MNNLVGISTGAVYEWTDSIDEQISILREAGAKGIEVLFPTKKYLDHLISLENQEYLRSIPYVSIHAPFHTGDEKRSEQQYQDNENTREIIGRLEKISKAINARSIVIHPDSVADFAPLLNTSMGICIENMDKGKRVRKEKLKHILEQHKFPFVFDSAHALTYGQAYMNNLLNEFKERIEHIHFSDRRYSEAKNKVKNHQQILYCQDLEKFNKLRSLACPVIIEVIIGPDKRGREQDIDNLRREMEAAERYFN